MHIDAVPEALDPAALNPVAFPDRRLGAGAVGRHLQGEPPDVAFDQFLRGAPLEDALTWNPEVNPAGCVCTEACRDHKWRIVYQTIAFALEER